VIFLCKYNKPFRGEIVIFFFELISKAHFQLKGVKFAKSFIY
jgi:hypothetical protein